MLPYVAVFVGDFIGGEGVVLLLLEGVFVFYEWYSVNFEVSSFTFYHSLQIMMLEPSGSHLRVLPCTLFTLETK